MFAVTVLFRLVPGSRDTFLPLMHVNARQSRSDEPGCLRFDVCTDPAKPDLVCLYELYTDSAAFDAHLASPHFRRFDAEVAGIVLSRQIDTWEEVAS